MLDETSKLSLGILKRKFEIKFGEEFQAGRVDFFSKAAKEILVKTVA